MAMLQHVYTQAALKAQLHVQLSVTDVEIPRVTPGEAKVRGQIARVFRGDPSLMGQGIKLEIDCCDEHDDIPPSGTLWTPVPQLQQAKVIEAYLNSGPSGFVVALWQSQILEQLTDSHAIVFTAADAEEDEDSLKSPSRRRFWISMTALLFVVLLALTALISAATY